MNTKILGIVAAMAGLTLVACGDDTTGSGGAGGSGTTTATGATTTATGATTTATTTTATTTTGGGAMCMTECAGDAGCALTPAAPETMACGDCVQAAADSLAACALVVVDPNNACQMDMACSDYVDCVLAQGATCEADFPAGAELAQAIVLQSCGACGNGMTM